MKFDSTLMTFVRKDLNKNLVPMLLGEPGIGKSSWLIALANTMHTKCFVLACNQLADKADLTGARLIPVTLTDGTQSYKLAFYPHAVIHDAIEYAKNHPRETPILFLDELNRTTPDVTSEALSLPTLRAIGSQSLPTNLRIVIAGNDKGNITALDEASISRFTLYHVEPDVNTFLSLDPELNPFVKKVLQNHPECIFCKTIAMVTNKNDDDDDNNKSVSIEEIIDDGDAMNQITTPRTISGISNWLNDFSNQELLDALNEIHMVDGVEISALQEGIEGHIGHTNFAILLLSEIASGITNTNNQSNVQTVGKPQCYDAMTACQNMSDLNDFINNMSDNDKSGCLVYALYENKDNTTFINALAHATTQLLPNDMNTLMMAGTSGKLDSDNISALLNSGTGLATNLAIILENWT